MGVFENIRTIKEWVKVEKIRGDEALALCPFHNDTNPSLHINIPRLLFHCFSCGKGGRLTSDTKSPTPTYEHFASIFVGEEEKKAFEEGLPIEYKHFDTDSIYLDYLFSRGLSIQTIKHFRLGYCTSGTYADRIIVPLEKGFVARTIHNEILAKVATGRREKYLFPLGLNISEMLFNKGKYDPIILCEGVFDVMRLYEIGYDAIGLFGARVYPAQIESLCKLGAREMVVALDSDSAGKTGRDEVAHNLGLFFRDIKVMDLPKGHDPGSVTENVWKICYQKIQKIGGFSFGKYNDFEIRK